MLKSTRQKQIEEAFSPGSKRKDEFLVLEGTQKVELGAGRNAAYGYLLGLFRDGEVEYHEIQQFDQPLKLTQYGIRHQYGLLAQDLSEESLKTSIGPYSVSNVAKLAEEADRYFLRQTHFEPEYELRAYIYRPLGVEGTRDYHIIWPMLNVASILFSTCLPANAEADASRFSQ